MKGGGSPQSGRAAAFCCVLEKSVLFEYRKTLCPERRRQLPTGWLCFHKQGAGRATFERFSPEALAERGNVPMTLTEILALLTFLVTTVYDTIDIVLRFREFRTKNGQKK